MRADPFPRYHSYSKRFGSPQARRSNGETDAIPPIKDTAREERERIDKENNVSYNIRVKQ